MIVGEDVRISHRAVIRRPDLVHLGSHVAIDEFVVISTALEAGSYIHISPHVSIIGGAEGVLRMGNFCNIAAGARIICRSDTFDGSGLVTVPGVPEEYKNEIVGKCITMCDFSSVETNAILAAGVCLADGVVVGANSLVLEPIEEPWTVWVGSPARKIKDRPREKMIEYAKRLMG